MDPRFETNGTTTSACLLLGVIFLIAPLAATAQQFGDFTYSSDGAAITITGYTGPGGSVTIPGTINGLPVTRTGNQAFRAKMSLLDVTIPIGVVSIERAAFYSCYSLTNVVIPNTITEIEYGAFIACRSLPTVTLPDTLTRIEDSLFHDCRSLTNVVLGAGVTSIGNSAFYLCQKLANITLPNGVTNIGLSAFRYCSSLTSVTIPGGVTLSGPMHSPTAPALQRSLWTLLIQPFATWMGSCSTKTSPCFGSAPAEDLETMRSQTASPALGARLSVAART